MLFIELDRTHERTYAKQIYTQIRKKIVTGLLKAGDRLPSTRELSKDLGVARNTVLTAYELLASEEFLYSLPGAGFYVGPEITWAKQPMLIVNSTVASLTDMALPSDLINFDSGLPALDLFPRSKWNHAAAQALNEAPTSVLGYDDPQGRPELRAVLAGYLKRTRGIECGPEQIMITSGTKQGLTLVAKCLLNDQSEVWIEDPTNENVKQIFSYHTDKIIPFGVDEQGIDPHLFPSERKPTLIFVTPSHQFPMGGILPTKRRLELIEFARKSGAFLLEDDYDSEFTYQGLPANSLFEFDSEHVIHAGTFSKTMFPSLRLGYLVVPNKLVPLVREWKRLADHHSNSICQLALMRFMESGELERHIRRMKRVYQARRDYLLSLIHRLFGGKVSVYGFQAGMHIVAEFEGVVFSAETIQQILYRGVYVVPVEKHALLSGKHSNQIILGYASLCYDDMEKGLEILKEVLEEH